MILKVRADGVRSRSLFVISLATLLFALQGFATQCRETLIQTEVKNLAVSTLASEVADFQISENHVRLVLKEGDWAGKSHKEFLNGNGSLDGRVGNAYLLKELLQQLATLPETHRILSQPQGYIEIDMSSVNRISSEVLGSLLMLHRHLSLTYNRSNTVVVEDAHVGNKLRLTGVQRDVYSFIQMSAMDRVLTIDLSQTNSH